MQRTSLSLSEKAIEILNETAQAARINKKTMALRCLKRLKKNIHKLQLIKRSTIRYNAESCAHKLYLYLPENVHNYAQALRNMEKISISYLVDMAVKLYAERLLRIMNSPRFNRGYVTLLDEVLRALHQKIGFQNRGVAGLHLIFARPARGVNRLRLPDHRRL